VLLEAWRRSGAHRYLPLLLNAAYERDSARQHDRQQVEIRQQIKMFWLLDEAVRVLYGGASWMQQGEGGQERAGKGSGSSSSHAGNGNSTLVASLQGGSLRGGRPEVAPPLGAELEAHMTPLLKGTPSSPVLFVVHTLQVRCRHVAKGVFTLQKVSSRCKYTGVCVCGCCSHAARCRHVASTPACLHVASTPACLHVASTPACLHVASTPACLHVASTPACVCVIVCWRASTLNSCFVSVA